MTSNEKELQAQKAVYYLGVVDSMVSSAESFAEAIMGLERLVAEDHLSSAPRLDRLLAAARLLAVVLAEVVAGCRREATALGWGVVSDD